MIHDHSSLQELVERAAPCGRGIEQLQQEACAQARLAVLAKVSAELVGTLDYDQVIAAIVRIAVPGLADACRIAIDGIDLQPGLLAGASAGTDATHAGTQHESREREVLVLPLVASAHRIGTLRLALTEPGRCFAEYQLAIAEEFAGCAARALAGALHGHRVQAALRARDEMLGMVAHDLRNPLNGIRLAADCIGQSPPADAEMDDRAWAEVIGRAAMRADQLISDLLDLNRLDAGALVLQRTELTAGDLLARSRSFFARTAAASGIQLEFAADDEHATLQGDAKRLLQVLSNLIENAIKFTPAGGRVRVTATSKKRELCFSVSDTGPGISAEACTQVFEKFWQAERGGHGGGCGLGLYITKAIVEAHGGRISIDSTPGHGSTFHVSIPGGPPLAKVRAVSDVSDAA